MNPEDQAREIKRLVEEIIRLSEEDHPPEDYYREFMERVLLALKAPAGAVWILGPQDHYHLQYQTNVQKVGLDPSQEIWRRLEELIRAAAFKAQAMIVPPRTSPDATGNKAPASGNPTEFVTLIVPILMDEQVAGMIEVWQDPRIHRNALLNQKQFIIQVSALATVYMRNHQMGRSL